MLRGWWIQQGGEMTEKGRESSFPRQIQMSNRRGNGPAREEATGSGTIAGLGRQRGSGPRPGSPANTQGLRGAQLDQQKGAAGGSTSEHGHCGLPCFCRQAAGTPGPRRSGGSTRCSQRGSGVKGTHQTREGRKPPTERPAVPLALSPALLSFTPATVSFSN